MLAGNWLEGASAALQATHGAEENSEKSTLTSGNIYWPNFRVSQTMCRTISGLALRSRWHVGCSNACPKQTKLESVETISA